LINEFKVDGPTHLKHNNACGLATRNSISEAYVAALACDPTSAFYGVLIANTKIDVPTAIEINKLFCEVVIAAEYDAEKRLRSYKKRKIELF
jgi:phosphoribosylaminoimidazolecarboxamide formyltransferase/IMP cyclohydrolase